MQEHRWHTTRLLLNMFHWEDMGERKLANALWAMIPRLVWL